MIRPATLDDLPKIMELAKELHALSIYSTDTFDDYVFLRHITGLINGAGVVFVSVKDNEVVGGLAGAITLQWFSLDKIAFDYTLFITSKHRHGITAMKLIKAFEHWAKSNGAKHIDIGITTGINVERTANLYRSLGYRNSGLLFRKDIT